MLSVSVPKICSPDDALFRNLRVSRTKSTNLVRSAEDVRREPGTRLSASSRCTCATATRTSSRRRRPRACAQFHLESHLWTIIESVHTFLMLC